MLFQTAKKATPSARAGKRRSTTGPQVRKPQPSEDEAVLQELEAMSLRSCGDFVDALMSKKG
jgi:hypothetical protein